MTLHDDPTGPPRRCRGLAALLLVGALVAGSCTGGDTSGDDATATTRHAPSGTAVPPTLAGGLELASVDPVQVLTGDGLAYGRPLPSQQLATDAFLDSPEVASVLVRRVYSRRDGRLLGEAVVLRLDGTELFDQRVLDAFVRGVVGALGEDGQDDVDIGGRTTVRSSGAAGTTIGYVEGDLLVVVRGPHEPDVSVVVERQLAALAAGVVGATDPQTPLVPAALDAAFVAVPTVTFQAIPPPEEEPPPEPPAMAGATAVQGRYGVVAGERRTTVWAFTVDPRTFPFAEPLEAALATLASARAGGAAAEEAEVVDRVVQRANGAEDGMSARTFRHKGLALLVEGPDPAQLDAVVSAWIAALAAQ